MNEKAIIDPNKIHLETVRVISGSVNSDPNVDQSQIVEFKTSFEVSQGVAPETNSVRFIFHAKLDAITENSVVLAVNAEYTIEYVFVVENLVDFFEKKDNIVLLDMGMAAVLMGIVYSTTRGIILTRTQGTLMDGVLLPVLNPRDLIKNNTL